MGQKKKARSHQRKVNKQYEATAESEFLQRMKYVQGKFTPKESEQHPMHPDDDLDGLLEHLHAQSDMDVKFLEKSMPNLAKELQEGKVEAETVAFQIMHDHYTKKYQLPNRAMLRHQKVQNAVVLTLKCIPDQGRLRYQDYYGFYEALWDCVVKSDYWELFWAVAFKEAVDKVCTQRASRIDDELLDGQKGLFLSICPIYNLDSEELNEMLVNGDDFEQELHIREDLLFHAALLLTRKVRDIHKSCWECGMLQKRLMFCSKCSCALYCSANCQTTAWRQGHKISCTRLASATRALTESIETIDRMHSSRDSIQTNFNQASDYTLLSPIHVQDSLQEILTSNIEGPSMKFFYNNFLMVITGDWWIFDKPIAIEESEHPANKDSEQETFLRIAFILAHDIFAYGQDAFDWESLADDAESNLELSCRMPAERFIHLYQTMLPSHLSEDGSEYRKRRLDMIRSAYAGIKEEFHKMPAAS